MGISGLTAAGFYSLAGSASGDPGVEPKSQGPAKQSPEEILQKLLEGNRRFMKGEPRNPRRKPEDFAKLVAGQNPRAVIMGCSDSRVPPELLFDQGIGDLFVVRVAGNVVSGAGPLVKGSIEYAVAELGITLIMVLGHSSCGAVKAAVSHIRSHDVLPGSLNELVSRIRPAVAATMDQQGDPVENAIRANVRIGVDRLKTLEPIVAGPIRQGVLKVVGAVYDLGTACVTVLE